VIVLTSVVSIIENATSEEWTGSPDPPDLVSSTRAAEAPEGIELRHELRRSCSPQAIERHSNHNDGRSDITQARSWIPPVVVYPPPPPPPISIAEMNVPPPPPMPTLSSPHSSLIPSEPRSATSDKLDDEQQSLRDLRDTLVGARFTIAAKRQELRDLQIETSAKDGFVFNLLRQYLNKIGVEVPLDIEEAFVDASSLRDRLGLLEAEYDEAEAGYNTLEWKYSRRETRFVEEVLDNKLVPSEALDRSRSAENLEILQLTHSTTGSSSAHPTIADPADSGDHSAVSHDTQLSRSLSEQAIVSTHRASAKSHQSRFQRSNLNDSHETHSHLRWVEKMNTIDEWLFEIVDTSRLQKLSLKATHDFGFTDTELWWDHTKWLLIQDYSTYFHTGDSTVSDYTTGDRVISSTKDAVSSRSTVPEPRSSSQILLGIHPSDVFDTANLPSALESKGGNETDEKERTLSERSADTREEVTSSSCNPHSTRCRTSQTSIMTDYDGNRNHNNHCDVSLSIIEGAFHQTEPKSWNTGSTSLRRGDTVPRRRTVPDIERAEPVEAPVQSRSSKIPSFSPHNFPSAAVHSNSEKLHRRHSSQADSRHRKYSASIRPSEATTPHPEPPNTAQISTKERCLVM